MARQHLATVFHGQGRGLSWQFLAQTSGQVAAMLQLCSLPPEELIEAHSNLVATSPRGILCARKTW